MLSNEEIKQIAQIMREELKPVNERLDKIETRLDKVEEQLDELEYNVEIVKGATNALTEWAEAASKYYTPQIHFPLEKDEKIS